MEQSQKQAQSMYQPLIEKLREDNPPLPLWPKSFNLQDDAPRLGGTGNLLKLTRFRG
jgi:hypothetical protein